MTFHSNPVLYDVLHARKNVRIRPYLYRTMFPGHGRLYKHSMKKISVLRKFKVYMSPQAPTPKARRIYYLRCQEQNHPKFFTSNRPAKAVSEKNLHPLKTETQCRHCPHQKAAALKFENSKPPRGHRKARPHYPPARERSISRGTTAVEISRAAKHHTPAHRHSEGWWYRWWYRWGGRAFKSSSRGPAARSYQSARVPPQDARVDVLLHFSSSLHPRREPDIATEEAMKARARMAAGLLVLALLVAPGSSLALTTFGKSSPQNTNNNNQNNDNKHSGESKFRACPAMCVPSLVADDG